MAKDHKDPPPPPPTPTPPPTGGKDGTKSLQFQSPARHDEDSGQEVDPDAETDPDAPMETTCLQAAFLQSDVANNNVIEDDTTIMTHPSFKAITDN